MSFLGISAFLLGVIGVGVWGLLWLDRIADADIKRTKETV